MDENELKQMVDCDIEYCIGLWDESSHDWIVLEELFNRILFKYIDIIEGIDDNLKVISAYEEKNKKGDIYRYNIKLLIGRLKAFKENGYSNDGILQKYIQNAKNIPGPRLYSPLEFNAVRIYISENADLTYAEKTEITEKIDEIEEICMSVDMPERKWKHLRPFVVWASGKDVFVAVRVLPLILMIV